MNTDKVLLSKVITIKRQFQKSIYLEDDVNQANALDGYIPLAENMNLIKSVLTDIASERVGAFTITGPYGSGKSSLSLVINGIINKNSVLHQKAANILSGYVSSDFLKLVEYKVSSDDWNVINITAKHSSLRDELFSYMSKDNIADEDLSDLIKKEYKKHKLLIIADEFGKFIELAIKNDDIILFQTLAEISARSHGRFVFIGILHQSFEGYISNLNIELKNNWAKVQGRFQNYNVISNINSTLRLLENSIEHKICIESDSYEDLIKVAFTKKAEDVERINTIFKNLYPLHPIAAMLLSSLSKKPYGQNERSIFSFLTSNEVYGFDDFLKNYYVGDIYCVSDFFNFLVGNYNYIISSSQDSHVWMTIMTALSYLEIHFEKDVVDLYKTIASIYLFGSIYGINATKEVLYSCFRNWDIEVFNKKLEVLEKSRTIIYRRFNNSFSIFEGSDFVIEDELKKELEKTNVDFSLLDCYLHKNTLFVAKDHYFKTGALRWMNLKIVSD